MLFADDAEMATLTVSDEFARELERRGIRAGERNGDIRLRGAVAALMDVVEPRQVRPLASCDEVAVPDGRRGHVVDMLGGGAAYLVEFEMQDGSGRCVTERFEAGELLPVREG